MNETDLATSFAIFAAKQADASEVTPDHLLLGCLRTVSRFGIASVGPWTLDLEAMGVDWMRQPEGARPKVAYSQESVELFDRAARIARSAGESGVGIQHMLAAFAAEDSGLMGQLKREHEITSASWRAAVAASGLGQAGLKADAAPNGAGPEPAEKKTAREYLTPEEAAETLGIHVQTMRGYIRSGRLPAYRLAGERAIRILRSDLEKVLEPLKGEK